jgi:protein SCO1
VTSPGKRWAWVALAIGIGLLAVSHFSGSAAAARPSLVGAITMPEGSTPAPEFRLHDQTGASIDLRGFRGQVLVVAFLDSHCTQACPVEGAQLAMAQRRLGDRTRFVLVVVSVAPDGDTPASVQEFARQRQWTGQWHWLLGSRQELSPVWRAYGVNVVASADDIAHSVGIFLIDRKGFERAILTGDPATLAQDVGALASS